MSAKHDEAKQALRKIIEGCCEITGWGEGEVRNFMSCIVADDPETLIDDIARAVEIAKRAENVVAVVDLMKRLGRALQVQVDADGELLARINPEADVKRVEGGYSIDIDWEPIGGRRDE